MSFSISRQICQLENCIHGPEEHPISVDCMEDQNEEELLNLDPDDQAILDNAQFLKASSHFYGQEDATGKIETLLRSDSLDDNFAAYVNSSNEDKDKENYNPDVNQNDSLLRKSEGGEDINQAINNFYQYWSKPENQEILYKTPLIVFDSIIKDPRFENYCNMFSSCRLKFHQLGVERGRDLMIHFISERNIRYFQNFDIMLFGANTVSQTANQKDLELLKVEFESKVSFLVDSVKTVEEHIKTIDSSHEALRDTINCVSEAAHGLSAAKRSFELLQERDPSYSPVISNTARDMPKKSVSIPKLKTVYKKEHLSIPIGMNDELVISQISVYNKGLTLSDFKLFEGLSKMKAEVFLRALNLPWALLTKWANSSPDNSSIGIARTLIPMIMNLVPLPAKVEF
ncbi:ORF2 [Shayang Fly Virus 3]|uniref:ORF2 n=1 Tax=Shayang Fly Virus 3 TaxID=1608067 RepID=A0A0B5KXF0_9RHAB|nr:ORF2 [Shayang Fly Virus 3]AJG39128.1 ORF2 [Shayang Fly Virus 3]